MTGDFFLEGIIDLYLINKSDCNLYQCFDWMIEYYFRERCMSRIENMLLLIM